MLNDTDMFGFNGRDKRRSICSNLNWEHGQYVERLREMYVDQKMSAQEIADYINQNTPKYIKITARSIQRTLAKLGLTRSVKDSFNNAMKRNRVIWAYKELKLKRPTQLSPRVRYSILKRDNFKCVLCGAGADTSVLEVDHIVAKCNGGTNEDYNLRTLCNNCNSGKRLVENER